MAIEYQGDTAIFTGICTIEEGEGFFEWIREQESPSVKFRDIEHIHTAILQTLLYFKPSIEGIDEDPFWGNFIFNKEF